MWQFVGRRLKDTAERTCNVLNLRSTFSTCSPESRAVFVEKQSNDDLSGKQQNHQNECDFYIWKYSRPQQDQFRRNPFVTDAQYTLGKFCRDRKEKQKQQQQFDGWLDISLLKWVS